MNAPASQAKGVQRPLFLTGMMGCGKTTVGRILADSLGCPLVDLDTRIERLFGTSVRALLAEGEPRFRAREREALESLLVEPGFVHRPTIVATGGGAILAAESRAAMDEAGTRVFIEVSVDELVRRLTIAEAEDRGARPLLHEGARLRARVAELLTARSSLYRSASLRVDGQGAAAEVAERIMIAAGADPGTRGSEAV